MAHLPPFDPMNAPPSPAYPSASPIVHNPSGGERFAQVMQAVIPALAAAAAFKQGQLGSFTDACLRTRMAGQQHQMEQQRAVQQDMQRQEQAQRQAEQHRMQLMQFEQAQQDRQLRLQQQAEDRK